MASVFLGSWPLPVLKPVWDGQRAARRVNDFFGQLLLRRSKRNVSVSEEKLWKLNEKYYQDWEKAQKNKNTDRLGTTSRSQQNIRLRGRKNHFFQIPTLGFHAECQKEHRCQNWHGVCSHAALWLTWPWVTHSTSWFSFLICKLRLIAYFADVKRQRREVSLAHCLAINRDLGFPGGSVVKNLPANAGDRGSIHRRGGSLEEGNGNPLLYSCLENPVDGGEWWATVQGITKELELDITQWLNINSNNSK